MSSGTELIINTTRVDTQIIASGLAVSLFGDSVTETMLGLPGPAGPKGVDGINGLDGASGHKGLRARMARMVRACPWAN